MKHHTTFFILVTLAASLAHYLIMSGLSQAAAFGPGAAAMFLAPAAWLLTEPMNFLLSTSFGQTLSPTPYYVLFDANSLLWGGAVGAIMLWRRLRYE